MFDGSWPLLIGGAVTDLEVICSASSYAVGGTISGLSGFVVLQNNGTDDLTVAANGTFTFGTKVADGADYSVTILTQPTGQVCNVTSAMGTITGGPSSSVVVTCTTLTYSLGGNVSGLSGTLVLSNNITDVSTTSEGYVGGQMHTLAVINGELWAWGANSSGQLGNAMPSTLRLPTKIGAFLPQTASCSSCRQERLDHRHRRAALADVHEHR